MRTAPIDPISPISEVAASIRSHRTTSVDLVERCLEAIDQRDGEINAFIQVFADDAREGAGGPTANSQQGTTVVCSMGSRSL